MLRAFYVCLRTDAQTAIRSRSKWLQPILFFIVFVSLFGIGLGFDNQSLKKVSPGIIWIGFLLTSMLNIEALMHADKEEGILEQFILSPYPLWWLMSSKMVALWLISCLPLILLMPLVGIMMHLSVSEIGLLTLSLILGSPALICIGIFGAALTVTLPRSGLFLALLLFPLYVPILIFGESSASLLLSSQSPISQLLFLGAISILALTLTPHATAGALRVAD